MSEEIKLHHKILGGIVVIAACIGIRQCNDNHYEQQAEEAVKLLPSAPFEAQTFTSFEQCRRLNTMFPTKTERKEKGRYYKLFDVPCSEAWRQAQAYHSKLNPEKPMIGIGSFTSNNESLFLPVYKSDIAGLEYYGGISASYMATQIDSKKITEINKPMFEAGIKFN